MEVCFARLVFYLSNYHLTFNVSFASFDGISSASSHLDHEFDLGSYDGFFLHTVCKQVLF